MSLRQNFELMAAYNQWMNAKVHKASSNLDGTALAEDRGAFLGSLLGALNHIVVGDAITLRSTGVA
ncbi:hypothetical protein MKP05_10735 [Halomonas sp. EGI 63088]|uniref:Damage-inducible protein DinB n=1 Tax=Halomonas flagellata TaxID=2920385 RepID=A0ABS9RUU0_9GAMM|nr:hypothetical protein [Halomonas flagellata]MCH4563604.1 hypothetical protein [Halomonas flagellata]